MFPFNHQIRQKVNSMDHGVMNPMTGENVPSKDLLIQNDEHKGYLDTSKNYNNIGDFFNDMLMDYNANTTDEDRMESEKSMKGKLLLLNFLNPSSSTKHFNDVKNFEDTINSMISIFNSNPMLNEAASSYLQNRSSIVHDENGVFDVEATRKKLGFENKNKIKFSMPPYDTEFDYPFKDTDSNDPYDIERRRIHDEIVRKIKSGLL